MTGTVPEFAHIILCPCPRVKFAPGLHASLHIQLPITLRTFVYLGLLWISKNHSCWAKQWLRLRKECVF